jgi:hypothetical protein
MQAIENVAVLHTIGFMPNRWISGPHEQDRSRSLVRAAYGSLKPALLPTT